MEGSRRFRVVPPTPLRPWPWGASHLGCPGRPGGEGAPRRGNPPPSGITNSCFGRFPVGRCGKVWKAWESKLDSQSSLGCALGLLATYIKGAKGGGREHTSLRRPRLSLVASCSTVRPRFRALI